MKIKIIKPDGYVRVPFPSYDGVTKTKWVAELRSGFPQTEGRLKDGDGECCLGVLCRLQDRLSIAPNGVWTDNGSTGWLSSSNPYSGFFSISGSFPASCRVKVGKEYQESLAGCNDSGCSFDQIADIIDAFWFDPETEIA